MALLSGIVYFGVVDFYIYLKYNDYLRNDIDLRVNIDSVLFS